MICIDDINILLYADDIVILTDNENDMQQMLNHINEWCKKWRLSVNDAKSKVLHFRRKHIDRSNFDFHIGNVSLSYSDKYKYLGVVLNEYFDYTR